jgi:hypothetical protein
VKFCPKWRNAPHRPRESVSLPVKIKATESVKQNNDGKIKGGYTMTNDSRSLPKPQRAPLPSTEMIWQELAHSNIIEDVFGKDGIFAKLVAETLAYRLEAELTDHLGYEKYEANGRNSGSGRNGIPIRELHTWSGDTTIRGPVTA